MIKNCHLLTKVDLGRELGQHVDPSSLPKSLVNLLIRTRSRECLDPRGQIPALYGILPAFPSVLPHRYSVEPGQLVFETVTYLVRENAKGYCLHQDRLSAYNKFSKEETGIAKGMKP